MADDVTDDDGDPFVVENDRVEPVTTGRGSRCRHQIAGSDPGCG
jgi:hypothetical protein